MRFSRSGGRCVCGLEAEPCKCRDEHDKLRVRDGKPSRMGCKSPGLRHFLSLDSAEAIIDA